MPIPTTAALSSSSQLFAYLAAALCLVCRPQLAQQCQEHFRTSGTCITHSLGLGHHAERRALLSLRTARLLGHASVAACDILQACTLPWSLMHFSSRSAQNCVRLSACVCAGRRSTAPRSLRCCANGPARMRQDTAQDVKNSCPLWTVPVGGAAASLAALAGMSLQSEGQWLNDASLRALGLSTFAGLSTTVGAVFAVVRIVNSAQAPLSVCMLALQ